MILYQLNNSKIIVTIHFQYLWKKIYVCNSILIMCASYIMWFLALSRHVVSDSTLEHERRAHEISTLNHINEFNEKPDDLSRKAKWLKHAYAAVEKPTIPHEIFDKK